MERTGQSLKDALEELRQAADAVGRRLIGDEVAGHLREATRHTVKAARSALEELERKLDQRAQAPGGAPPPAGGPPPTA